MFRLIITDQAETVSNIEVIGLEIIIYAGHVCENLKIENAVHGIIYVFVLLSWPVVELLI